MNTGHFDGIHLYVTLQEDKTEILYCGLSKCAFLGLKNSQCLQRMSRTHIMMVWCCLGLADEDEDVIHHCLEHCQAVSETKEHD